MQSKKNCVVCGKRLTGRQRLFCSLHCKNSDTNFRHQSYLNQQSRGLARKLMLIRELGGKCSRCGYAKNVAALKWHHLDPGRKSFQLDMRALSNRTELAIREEVSKCILLCANCHAEEHSPAFMVSNLNRM